MIAPTGAIGATALARHLGSWRPAGPRPGYQALADGLRVLVLDGRVPVGTALPSERTLAEVLGVSRTTVAAAYAALRESGHLLSRQGARSVLSLPVQVPAEPLDLGAEADMIKLNIAAPAAPEQIVHDGFRHALECAPSYLAGTGLYPNGLRALTETIARRYTERGLPTDADQILVTSGAQHALRLVLDTHVCPGDRILLEQPTHHGTILALARHRARAVTVGLHPIYGWDLDQLESVVRLQRPRLIFVIPDFQNPTGLLLDEAGRIRLGEISARHRVPVVVDETMVELGLDVMAPPPLASFAPPGAQIITLGSASKTVWPGLRVGWIRVDGRPDTYALARYESDLGGAVFEQFAAQYALANLEAFLPARRARLREQRAAAMHAIAEHLPGAVPVRGVGGLCIWTALPRPVANATAAAAAELGVRLIPGGSAAAPRQRGGPRLASDVDRTARPLRHAPDHDVSRSTSSDRRTGG
ncbi:PLP-dependent aminotransferase family protein [Gordonia neofelifaecis]|uniref:Transcriptional regulator, GntR family with aminotransferase domain n=1 Tax=Gordonia neofelifaecis NRRL B-59395 TaxID=644548 RepID=F1YLW2_9ACTN|nr:PLP-dependent aminotransferase family protein [Gordonia neofelifaecis]EGD54213.1 transcriptional regulator, GntR family with aminotransferase domain [Gordonia neofelifaecis NRRL B-59395]